MNDANKETNVAYEEPKKKVYVKQGDEYTKGRGYSNHLREKPVECDAEREGENDRGEKDKGPIARACAQTHSKTVGLKSPV